MKWLYCYSLLVCSLFSRVHSFDVTTYIRPLFTFMVGTLGYFSFITDHFIPATQQELYETKQEVMQLMENNKRLMQEHAQKNIHKYCAQTKKEIENKIDKEVALAYQKSQSIKHALATTQKIVIKKIETNHRLTMTSLKKSLSTYTKEGQNEIETLIKKLTIAYKERDKEIQEKNTHILNLFVKFQKKLHKKIAYTQLLIQNSITKHKELLANHHQKRKVDNEQTSEKCDTFFAEINQKIDELERLCSTVKGVVLEQKNKNKELYNQILALKLFRSEYSIQSAFNKQNFSRSSLSLGNHL